MNFVDLSNVCGSLQCIPMSILLLPVILKLPVQRLCVVASLSDVRYTSAWVLELFGQMSERMNVKPIG